MVAPGLLGRASCSPIALFVSRDRRLCCIESLAEVTIDDSDDDDMQYEEVPDVGDDDEEEEDFQKTLATIKQQPTSQGTKLASTYASPEST